MVAQNTATDIPVPVELQEVQVIEKGESAVSVEKEEPSIEKSDWSGPYSSRFLQLHEHLRPLLKHVNCNYLSTRGQAPTLLELKQHSQALAILIKHLTFSTGPTAIDSVDACASSAELTGRAFDYLADLSKEYVNIDTAHGKPLTGCMNTLEDRGALYRGGRDHCPLHRAPTAGRPGSSATPYATHEALIKHADEILARLDHDFGAEGGILGILPLDGDGGPEANKLGRNSVLGQWISFTRRVVNKAHELGQSLEDALEHLAGEAVVPKALKSEKSLRDKPDGLLTIQDQWVVTMSPRTVQQFDTVFTLLEGDNAEQDSNLLTITGQTRYSRLRGGKTIFIQPSSTPEFPQARPVVTQVVKSEWRDTSSSWERQHNEDLESLRRQTASVESKDEEIQRHKDTITALLGEREQFLLQVGHKNDEWADPKAVADLEADKAQFEAKKAADRKEMARMDEEAQLLLADAKRRRQEIDRYYRSGGDSRPHWPEDDWVDM